MSSLPRLSILTFKGCTSNVSCKLCALSRACSRRPVGDAMPARQTHQHHASHREAATAIAAKLPSTLLFSLPGSKATFPGHGKRSTATRFDCPGNRPLGTHFLTRSGRRVLVHREHVSGNVRAHPARAGAFPCRQFFPAHPTRRCGLRATGGTGFVFPWADHGAAHRLSVATLWHRAVDPWIGRDRFHARTRAPSYRHHAGSPDRCGFHRRTRHDASVRGSRSDRGNGHRSSAFPRRTADARTGSSNAMSLHGFEHRGHLRQQPCLQSLFQHRVPLFPRSCERLIANSGHHHRHFEELSIRTAHRCDCLLPGINRQRRRRRGRHFDNFQRRHGHHGRDRVRYAIQRRLHYILPDMTKPTHMVELRDVYMQFEEKKILDDLSLRVEPQERLVVMGQTGSGKSTILRLILGTLRPNSGSIFFKQFEITRLQRRKLQAVRQHMGMVYQYSALLSSRNVRDNVAIPLEELTDKSRAEIDKIVDEKLELVGMKDSKDLLPEELSGGMRKRVALARALVLEPELILLDEPSAGLDPVIASVIDELIISLSKTAKVTSITVTHEMDSAFRIGTRMATLYQGKIIEEAELEKFKQSKNPVVAQFLSGSTEGPILEGSLDAITKK